MLNFVVHAIWMQYDVLHMPVLVFHALVGMNAVYDHRFALQIRHAHLSHKCFAVDDAAHQLSHESLHYRISHCLHRGHRAVMQIMGFR